MSLFPTTPTLYGDAGVPITTPTYNSYTPEELQYNALYVLWYFFSKGWSYEACCGIIGNMYVESRIVPTNRERIWENGQWTGDFGQGLGLIQWTPYTRVSEFLIHWGFNYEILQENMEGQCRQLYYEIDSAQSDASVWHTSGYESEYGLTQYILTRDEFKVIDDIPTAAGAFCVMRERPGVILGGSSAEAAQAAIVDRISAAYTMQSYLNHYFDNGRLIVNYGDFPAWFIAALCRKREEGGILAR